jgi:hypothetical protein
MSKQQSKVSHAKKEQNEIGFSFEKIIPEKFQTPALLILLLLLILVFFSPVTFGDKTTSSYDLSQVKSLREYATKDRDGVSLWNPYIFCGMPAVATSMSLRSYDITAFVYSYASKIYSSVLKDYNAIYTFSFVILAFASFFFMRNFGAGRGVSFLVSAATTFSTGIVVLFFIGHISKLMSLAVFPFILMMLFKFQKEIKPLDVLLFVLGIHILVLSAHVQIVFYFGLSALLYFIYFFIRSFISKDKFLQKQLLKSLGIGAAAGAIALLMSFDTYSQLYEYKPYSTRGTQSVAEQQSAKGQQSDSYEYNTNWSFSPGEVLTFIVPSYYGFGKSTYQGPLTNNQPYEVNTYFGQMPFVDTAMYMGIIVFALALFALFVRWKEPVVQFFGLLVVLFLLISFGRTFPVVFNLFYYYFPMFDNFRVPSMILHILQIFFPILAGFGIMKIISLREEKNIKIEKALRTIALVFGGLFVLSFILESSLSSWFTGRVKDYASSLGQTQQAQTFDALKDYMTNMFTGDFQVALALLALTFGLAYAYAASKIKKDLLIAGLAVLILFDLFRIDSRGANYANAAKEENKFKEPDYISVIKQQNDKEPFRLLNLKQDGSFGSPSNNANFHVRFLQEDFYGYSAVKPRSFQDIVETVNLVNPTLWKMLGIKYVVLDQPYQFEGFTPILQSQKTFVFKCDKVLSRVYFVDSVAQKSSVEILNAIKNNSFDPTKLAFVDKLDFKVDKTDLNTTVKITKYEEASLVAETNSGGNNFLFFSTTFLPGWKAFVDGAELKVYKTNHGFTGIVVPKGKHSVEFRYEPKGFVIGKNLSLILNILLFGGIGVAIFLNKKKTPKEKLVQND